MKLTWHFRYYAEKRNWLESMQEPASTYVNELMGLGFRIHFETYPDETGQALPADPMIERFFPQTLADESDETVDMPDNPIVESFVPVTPLPASRHPRPQTESKA